MAEVWPYRVNGLSESLQFETDIRFARLAEWRDGLKDATQRLTLTHILPHADAEAAVAKIRAAPLGEWDVPEWPNVTRVPATIASGATVLTVDVPGAYAVGQAVFIGFGGGAYELGAVDSVGASTITLAAPTGSAYAGTEAFPAVIAPVVRCIAPGGIAMETEFPITTLTIAFLSIEPTDLGANPYPLFQTIPVVTDGRVPLQALSGGVAREIDLIESGFGAYAMEEAEEFTRRSATASFYDDTAAKRWARRQFMHFIRGRDGEFWLPTGTKDLPLNAAIVAPDTTILVDPFAPAAQMVGRRIVIEGGGNRVFKQVTAASDGGGGQTLTVGAIGQAFAIDARVSIMTRCRFDTDVFGLNYVFTPGGFVAPMSAPVVEVP